MQLRSHTPARTGATIRTTLKVCLSSLALVTAASASTPTPTQINTSRANGLAWLYKNQQGDGSWRLPGGLQVQATSAALDAMMNAGIKSGSTFYSGIASLENAHPSSTDGQSRQINTLYQAGNNVYALTAKLLSQATALYGAWGPLPGYSTSVADTAMATVASVVATAHAVVVWTGYDSLMCNVIVPQQRSSGGWSYVGSLGNNPASAPTNASSASILPTVYAILMVQKVAPLGYSQFSCGMGTNYSAATIVSNGVAFLKTKLNQDGGFGENGTSGALETAMAYQAIKAVNPSDSALGNAQGYLVATQKSDGSWAGDPFQTALALQAYPATTLVSTAGDGMPDVVKTALNINVSTPTGSLKPGNGQSVAGVNKPFVSVGATLNQPMSYSLAGSGGTAPYQYALASGNLPPGLSVSSAGVITGTPTAVGPFSFTLQQTDANANLSYVDTQVNVGAPVDSADAPTLPQWGAIVMALVLLATMALNDKQRRKH
ncbi:MAG: hypothetical protein EKK47_13905 [Burkholderiales bacterium]|nr:MAG: hypothetical protein EKK47_13905 [Burkholderiales bacterium]